MTVLEKGQGREDNKKIRMTQTSFFFPHSGRIKNPAGN